MAEIAENLLRRKPYQVERGMKVAPEPLTMSSREIADLAEAEHLAAI
ncbi:hypothetical protein [Cereibacter sphaeroides]|nr:hypothetical protein [Cereibacter sphaeroides]EGJ21224.1 hypothetical protein RSWS8N_04060 [Cereibacter sphaeroides WS8N]QJC83913.1 hypothetical protein HGN32_06855 [Cereibacter sphaeroides]